ncbi:MAG: hypothetical protein V3U26_00465 [Dehalococcoidia bacterium]
MLQRNRTGDAIANLERRAFHLVSGCLFPVLIFVLSREPVVALAVVAVVASLTLEVARWRSATINHWFLAWFSVLLKKEESTRWLASTYLLIATLAAILLFDAHIAALALLFLAIGDPLAALVGERFGRIRIGRKSLEGTLTFLGASLLVGGVLVAGGVEVSYSIALAGAAVAALVELMPLPTDDNLTVPLAAGGVMMALA